MNIHNESGELTRCGSNLVKYNLYQRSIGANDPYFASLVSKHLYGEGSPVYQQHVAMQGAGENWVEFPPSCSPSQVQRFLSGQSVKLDLALAAAKAFTEVADLKAPELATDPLPLMAQLAAELQGYITTARQRPINDLVNPPEFHYARLVPLKDKDIEQLIVTPTSTGEATISALFRTQPIQVGLITPCAVGGNSIIYAPQPYRWTGAEVVVGRKKIRSIELSKDRVLSAIEGYQASIKNNIAS